MAKKSNIFIDQGATFSATFAVSNSTGYPMSLDGFTAVAQMRKEYESTNSYSFTTALGNSEIYLYMSASTTNAIPDGRYCYDVKITNVSGVADRIVEGIVTVSPQASR